jgi:radical SAM superfamily enzyme YgiQ (UPF0313 family)
MPRYKTIWFISPCRPRNPGEDFVFKMSFLNLPYLAAATPPGYSLRIVDEEYEKIDFDGAVDLVALTAQTPVAPSAYRIADRFRRRGVTVVMGGVHASTLPEEALEHVDAVVVGEGEFVWPSLLADLEEGNLQRVYDAGTDHRLAGVAAPRRDLIDAAHYIPLTMAETTRGCPHQCDFCGVSRFFGHHYRKRPVGEVIAELKNTLGPRFRNNWSRRLAARGWDLPYFIEKRLVYFIDSNFGADRSYTRELMAALETMDLLWWAHVTVDIADDDDFLQRMAASGGIALNIGFETLSDDNLRTMSKSFAGRHDYRRAIRRIHDHGIGIMGTFVVGFDNEEESIFDRILDFVQETRLDWALVFIRTPYPGTRLFDEMEAAGRILTRDWEKYDTLNCIFEPVGTTPQALERGLRRVWKNIFSLPSLYHRILKPPRVHPLFYLGMNLQFYHMVRRWRV